MTDDVRSAHTQQHHAERAAAELMLRRFELDAKNLHGPFLEAFSGLQMAGFHTYGESYLAHINQTLTGLWFG